MVNIQIMRVQTSSYSYVAVDFLCGFAQTPQLRVNTRLAVLGTETVRD